MRRLRQSAERRRHLFRASERDDGVLLSNGRFGHGAVMLAVASCAIFTTHAGAATQYFAGDASALSAAKYAATAAGPFTSAFVTGSTIDFATVNGTGTGATINAGGFIAEENFTLSASGTLGTGGTVATVNVFSGKTLNFGSQAISAAAGTGFIKSGDGTFVTAGSAYAGGFTLNAGTIVAGGINAFGNGAVTINGGTIAASGNRAVVNVTGITLGGDFTFGSSVAPATSASNISFTAPVSLGTATRAITIGGSGTYTFSGILSQTAGSTAGLTVNGSGNGGVLALTTGSTSTFTGPITINSGAILSTNSTLAINGNNTTNSLIINDGGTYRFTSTGYVQPKPVVLNGGLDTIDTTVSTSSYGVSLSGGVSGTGTLVKAGVGTLRLSGSNSYSGGTNLTAGVLEFTTTSAIPAGTTAISNNATFRYTNTAVTAASLASNRLFTIGTGGATFEFNNATTPNQVFTLSGAISDAAGVVTPGTLTKTGTNALALDGANTYTGQTVVTGGTLQIGAGGTTGTLGSGAVTVGSALAFNRTNTLAVANAISGTGTVTQAGSGITILSGSSTYSGGTTISAGTLEFQTTASLPATGAINAAAATVAAVAVGGAGQFDVTSADAFRASRVTFAAGAFYGVDTASAIGDTNYSLPISNTAGGSLGLAKLGANSLTLTGANSYTGGTNVVGGSLVVGDGSTNGAVGSGPVALSSGTTLVFNRSDTYNSPTGLISGAGAVVQNGSGTLVLATSSTYSGGTTINNGAISVNNTGNLGGNSNPVVINAGRLILTAGISSGKPFTLGAPTSTIEITSGTLTDSGLFTGTGALNKAGSGAITLTGTSNNYSGGTVVSAGTLTASAANALGTGDLSVSPSATAPGPVTANVGNNAALANTANVAVNNNGAITGTVNFTSTAPVIATLSGNGNVGLTGATVAGTNLTIGGASSTTFSGAIGGNTGAITKSGAGKLTLSGPNTYASGTTVAGGTLLSNGSGSLGSGPTTVSGTSITAFGTLGGIGSTGGPVAVNSFGVITAGTGATTSDTPGPLATGSQTWASGGKYVWKTLASSGTAGTTWDLLSIAGTLTANAGFTVQAILGNGGTFVVPTTPGETATFQIAHADSITGLASQLVLNTDGLGIPSDAGTFTLSFEPGGGGYDVNLNFQATPEPTTAVLVGLGASTFLGRRRRRTARGASILGMLRLKR